MLVRRVTAWISTAMVAIAVALALPVSQLRVIGELRSCCCPDPATCHCFDHRVDPRDVPGAPPEMRACHSTERDIVAPTLPAFGVPVVAAVARPVIAVRVLAHDLPGPHPAPPRARPAAPS